MKNLIKKMVAEDIAKDKAFITKVVEVMNEEATLEELDSLCEEILERGRMSKKEKIKFILF
ncbi:MAG: hypothetical protein E7536_02950 [Ruminococcaceae bacterium]|nr:hypothetical protein [Oscillospiraceae bacterium]